MIIKAWKDLFGFPFKLYIQLPSQFLEKWRPNDPVTQGLGTAPESAPGGPPPITRVTPEQLEAMRLPFSGFRKTPQVKSQIRDFNRNIRNQFTPNPYQGVLGFPGLQPFQGALGFTPQQPAPTFDTDLLMRMFNG